MNKIDVLMIVGLVSADAMTAEHKELRDKLIQKLKDFEGYAINASTTKTNPVDLIEENSILLELYRSRTVDTYKEILYDSFATSRPGYFLDNIHLVIDTNTHINRIIVGGFFLDREILANLILLKKVLSEHEIVIKKDLVAIRDPKKEEVVYEILKDFGFKVE